MTERKWTPGGWRVGSEVYHEDRPYGFNIAGDDGYHIAKVSSRSAMGGEDAFDGENKANAHLIAAAPDLYDASQGAIDSLEFALSEMASNDIISQEDADLIIDRIATLQLAADKARGGV